MAVGEQHASSTHRFVQSSHHCPDSIVGEYGPRRTNGRKATASQVRALDAISNRLQLNMEQSLLEKHGIRLASELSIAEASAAIDELNSTTSVNGANH